MKQKYNSRQHGITLMELLIVVAIISMIAAFAYPSYTEYVVRTKRTAATTTLLQIADRQQQFWMDNKRYADDLTDLGYGGNPYWVSDQGNSVVAGDSDAVYVFGLVNVTPTAYVAFGVPVNQQQVRDTKCGAMTVDQAGARRSYGTENNCW